MLGARLILARKKAGHSLRSLSGAIGTRVSAQAIGKYERNEMAPSSDILSLLAKELGVSMGFLFSNQIEELLDVDFRKKSTTTAQERAQVEALVIEHLERYLEIEDILQLNSSEWVMPLGKPYFLQHEADAEAMAEKIREVWNLGEDPIPDMTELLEEQGIKVLILDLPDDFSGLTSIVRRANGKPEVPVIIISQNVTLERRRFTLAHELAHRLIDEASPCNHEKASDMFAGAFLMVANHVRAQIGESRKSISYAEILDLKHMYRVSAAAVLVRLKQLNVLSASAINYAFRTFAKTWRFEEPDPLESVVGSQEKAKRFERLCLRALSERYISLSKGVELLRVSLSVLEEKLKGPAHADANHNYG